MQKFLVQYKETTRAYFAVEAPDEEEALLRFEEWRLAEDNVYTTINNTDHFESEASVVDPDQDPNIYVGEEDQFGLNDDDVLTDEHYRDMY